MKAPHVKVKGAFGSVVSKLLSLIYEWFYCHTSLLVERGGGGILAPTE